MSAHYWGQDDQRGYDIGYEAATYEAVQTAIAALIMLARPIWHQGDGEGGVVMSWILDAAESEGLDTARTRPPSKTRTRNPMSAGKRAQVFARDGLRCVFCGTTQNLTVDHIVAHSKGGSDDLDNLQTLCRSCNSGKRDR